MKCNAMKCNAIQGNATNCNTMKSNAMQYNAMKCNAMQCNAMQYNAMHGNAIHCNTMKHNPMQYNALHLNAIHRTSTLIILSSNPQSNAFHESTYPKCIPNAAEAPNVQCYCNDSSEVQRISLNWLQLVQSEEWTKVVKLIST